MFPRAALFVPAFAVVTALSIAAPAFAQTSTSSDQTPAVAAPAPDAAPAASATPAAAAKVARPARADRDHANRNLADRDHGDRGARFAAFRRRHDPLAGLPRPLTAQAVKDVLDKRFEARPHVKSVTEIGSNILRVEVTMPSGKNFTYEINRTTGAHRPAW